MPVTRKIQTVVVGFARCDFRSDNVTVQLWTVTLKDAHEDGCESEAKAEYITTPLILSATQLINELYS